MTLIYDAATMSTTPQSALTFTLLLAAAAVGNWAWARWRGHGGGTLVRFFAAGSLLFAGVTGATVYEQRLIVQAAASGQLKVVQGPLHSLWEDRVLRAGGKNDYARWQGFRIGESAFSYCRNTETNYFNNAGSSTLELREGMQLRLHYLEHGSGDALRRDIVRVELAS